MQIKYKQSILYGESDITKLVYSSLAIVNASDYKIITNMYC